jgi:xylulose-5-phosphate/fructose-6-phosphate phosphoketolase
MFEFDAKLSTAIDSTSALPASRAQPAKGPLPPALLDQMNRYWQAASYLIVGQIYLLDNPLLRQPLQVKHIKSRLLGHWGTSPGQSFIYVHLNRLVRPARSLRRRSAA